MWINIKLLCYSNVSLVHGPNRVILVSGGRGTQARCFRRRSLPISAIRPIHVIHTYLFSLLWPANIPLPCNRRFGPGASPLISFFSST